MASKVVTFRIDVGALARLDARAEAEGKGRTDVLLDALAAHLAGYREEPPTAAQPPSPRPQPTAAPQAKPRVAAARAALAEAEARTGAEPVKGRAALAMERAGTYVWNGEKRPTYQKGQAARAKGKR